MRCGQAAMFCQRCGQRLRQCFYRCLCDRPRVSCGFNEKVTGGGYCCIVIGSERIRPGDPLLRAGAVIDGHQRKSMRGAIGIAPDLQHAKTCVAAGFVIGGEGGVPCGEIGDFVVGDELHDYGAFFEETDVILPSAIPLPSILEACATWFKICCLSWSGKLRLSTRS